ncbi:MAG: DUF11 domain-containing protein [Thermus sp.]|uniref:DUF11 domain-containing protein n=1 Tax=Thermus TaxID=270 RepID=UPI00036BF915|nr:DUF11 domain-containing protein [Thermus oshimai]
MRKGLALLLLSAWALGQSLTLKATVPGAELGWAVTGLEAWLLPEGGPVKVEVYSPGFDPTDYRSALKGQEELGDERYDGGQGEVEALFRLERRGEVLREARFGVEPHRWVTLWEGPLPQEPHLLSSAFKGLGKNAFVYRISGARLVLDDAPQLLDVYSIGLTLRQLPPERGGWVELLALEAERPFTVHFYDEDGPQELESKAVYPGFEETRPVSGDLEWIPYTLRQAGVVRFLFRQPPTAKQYSNTLAFRAEACLEALPGRFKAVPPGRVETSVVDPQGNPLPLPIKAEGRRFRPELPPGHRLLQVEGEGAVRIGEGWAEVGCPGGKVRFVVEPPKATLEVEALLLQDRTLPARLTLHVNGTPQRLEGQARLDLQPGRHTLRWETPGLIPLDPLPQEVSLAPRETQRLQVRFRPQVDLTLEPKHQEVRRGERGRLTLQATTPYPGLLPAELALDLPPELTPLGPTRLSGPLGAGRPLTLEVPFRAENGGSLLARGSLLPYGLERTAEVRVFLPAALTLKKEALTPEVPAGGEARFGLTVANEGDEPAQATLIDRFLDKEVRIEVALGPREGRTYTLAFPLPESAQGTLVNQAQLGQLKAEASVRVLRPEARLAREQAHRVYLPGEVVEVRLRVKNPGEAPLHYRLTDRCPDGFTPLSQPTFEGLLSPGEERVHTYRLRVEFGPEVEGVCQAELTGNAERRQAQTPIARRLLKLSKVAEPARILEGGEGRFLLWVENPADHEVEVKLRDVPDPALGLLLEEKILRLAPGEVWKGEVPFRAPAPGRYRNTLQAQIGEALATFPAEAVVESLPLLVPERISTLSLRYQVEGPGGSLLLAHTPPEGSAYIPGSARLNGLPLEDPRRLEDGRLAWRLPFPGGKAQGEVTYQVRHQRALPPLSEPQLTLVALDREIPLKGTLTLKDYERGRPLEGERPGLIREPKEGAILGERARLVVQAPMGPIEVLLNGKPVPKELLGEAQYDERAGVQRLAYYGLPLEEGRNILEVVTPGAYDRVEVFRPGSPVKLVAEPVRAVADGRTPLEFRLKAVDALGLPSGFGFVTLEADPEPIAADASPLEPGYQVLLKDGVAQVLLKPLPTPREVALRYRFGRLEGSLTLQPKGPTSTLWLAQASLTLGYDLAQGQPYLQGLGRAYGEGPLLRGSFQGALDTTGDLARTPDPRFLPLTGSGTEAKRPLASDDPVAFRYMEGGLALSYERAPLGPNLPEATALRLRALGPLEAEAFLGLLPMGRVEEEIVPDGGSSYRLRFLPKPGSLALYLREGARETLLQEGKDYILDRATGHLHLARPLLPFTPDFAPVRLLAVYAPESAPREALAYGLSAGYKEGAFRARLGAAYYEGWRFGGEVGYEAGGNRALLTYRQEEGKPPTFGLTLAYREGPLEARGDLRYAFGNAPEGQARLAYDLGPLALALEQSGPKTALAAEAKLGGPFRAGAGVGYDWGLKSTFLLARLAYQEGEDRLALSYYTPGEGELSARFGLAPGLFLEGGLRYREELAGSLGLKSTLGGANLALSYELPTASGEGNRARFGLEAPLPLDERWSLNLTAGLAYKLDTEEGQSALGLGLRYRTEDFVATLAGEWASGRLLFRAGAAGTPAEDQALALDLTLEALPETKLGFSVSYALWAEGFTLLTHHLYKEGTLEGQTLANLHGRDFSVRPSLLYRYPFGDLEGSALEVGLGGTYLFGAFGFGGNLYYGFLPLLGEGSGAFSLEGTWRALEGFWLSLGYTFGETAFRRPGPYLRLDLFGGGR